MTTKKEKIQEQVMEEAKHEVATIDANERNLMQQEDLGAYYSLQAVTREDKIKMYNAINNPDARLGDHINEVIKAKDLLIEVIELVNESSGELQKVPRIIIIDDMGKSYVAVSVGVFSALKRIVKLFGDPSWDEPIEMKVKQVTKADRKLLTLELV